MVFGPSFIKNIVLLQQIGNAVFPGRKLLRRVNEQIKIYELQTAFLKANACILSRKENYMFRNLCFISGASQYLRDTTKSAMRSQIFDP